MIEQRRKINEFITNLMFYGPFNQVLYYTTANELFFKYHKSIFCIFVLFQYVTTGSGTWHCGSLCVNIKITEIKLESNMNKSELLYQHINRIQ